MLLKMVEDVEGCNIGVKHLRIIKVTNPRVIYNGLNEDLDATFRGLVGLVVLE
jgi:hypothetical protein